MTEVCRRFDEIVDKVQYQGDTVVIEKNGKPAAVLIPFALFEKFLKNRQILYQVMVEVQQQNQENEMNEKELMALIHEAIHETRPTK